MKTSNHFFFLSDKEDDYTQEFSSDEETAQEKKLRLTKKYLEQIEKEGNFISCFLITLS